MPGVNALLVDAGNRRPVGLRRREYFKGHEFVGNVGNVDNVDNVGNVRNVINVINLS